MKPALLAVAFLGLVLAGCNTRGSGDQDAPDGEYREEVGGEPDLFLVRSPAHATVRAHMDNATIGLDYRFNKRYCTEDANTFNTFTAYLKIWNRTGLAMYQAKAFRLDQESYMDFTVDLPGDPPYLIAAGAYCFRGGYTIEIQSPEGKVDAEHLDIHPPEPDALLKYALRDGEVTVPALTTEAVGHFGVGPEVTEILAGFLPGDTEKTGSTYGVLDFYEPNGTPGQDQWQSRIETVPVSGTEWVQDRYFAAMPGGYPLHLTLPQPFPTDTIWTTRLAVYEFTPKVGELGFQQPFRDYTECTGRATDASGLLDCSP